MEDAPDSFRNLLKCMIDNECIEKYDDDGLCLAQDSDAMQVKSKSKISKNSKKRVRP